MKIRFLYIVVIFTIALSNSVAIAQLDVTKNIQELYSIWNKHYPNYSHDHLNGSRQDAISLLEKVEGTSDFSTLNLSSEIRSLESEMLEKDWGLQWRSGGQVNSSPGLEVADNLVYRSRLQSEVSWDILKNGYFDNQAKSQIKLNEAKILSIEDKEDSKGYEHLVKWQNIIYQFNKNKIILLEKKLDLNQSKMQTIQELHIQGKISQEEYLKNLQKVAETRSLIKVYTDYNGQLKHVYDSDSISFNFPLIDLNYAYLFDALNNTSNDSINQFLLENIELDQKNKNDISLKTFARYNAYNFATTNALNRSFFTFGATLTLPIIFDKKTQEKITELKKQQVGSEDSQLQRKELNGTLEYFYEFRYKLKQFHTFYFKRLITQELLRKEQARYDIDRLSFNPVYALRLLEDLISIDIELIDLKQQMYLHALNIYTVTPYVNLNEMIKPISLDSSIVADSKSPISGVYIWSSAVKKYSAEYLNNYLALEKFNTVVISLGGDYSSQNVKKVNTLVESGIEAELLIGSNKLLFGDFSEQLVSLAKNIQGLSIKKIHLDIEPHTLDDWKVKKEEYQTLYINMLSAYASFCKAQNIELSVSIPLHYSESFKTTISSKVDLIYYMCYENIKTEYIKKKILGDGKPFVIALRTEDFANRVELEQKANELNTLLNPSKIIIHDLKRLMAFKTN